jgi:putative toxin-antitoxin system antitoxin component (TIGR02293 family)
MPSSVDTPTAASLIPEIGADPVAAVRAGLPYAALEPVREHLEASDDLLAQALGISARTLRRRRKTGTLTPDESDRLVLLTRDCFDFTRWHFRQGVTTADCWKPSV